MMVGDRNITTIVKKNFFSKKPNLSKTVLYIKKKGKLCMYASDENNHSPSLKYISLTKTVHLFLYKKETLIRFSNTLLSV